MVRNILPRVFDPYKEFQALRNDVNRIDRELIAGLDQVNQAIGNIGLWQDWTPAYSANFTIGNSDVTARWARVGGIAFVRLDIVLGSTSSVNGNFAISLPVTGASASGRTYPLGIAFASADTSNAGNTFKGAPVNAGPGSMTQFSVIEQGSTAGGFWDDTNPFTWGTGDVMQMSMWYEIA